jgi:hypothetical protein
MALIPSRHSNKDMSAIVFATRLRATSSQSAAHIASAAMAGLAAGTAAIVLMQWLSIVVYDESPWKLPRMMAAIVGGAGLLGDDEFAAAPVALGFAVHYALSLVYALALAGVLATLRRRHACTVGLAFGIALYVVNLHGFTALFPWFAELRTPDTLVAHALFGLVAAGTYSALSRHAQDPAA